MLKEEEKVIHQLKEKYLIKMPEIKQTKKDEVAEFCHLLIKINIKTKGHWRIGQMIANGIIEMGIADCDPFYKDNTIMLDGMQKLYDTLKKDN